MPATAFSWTQTSTLLRNKQVFRCPSDLSANWNDAVTARKTSYFLNAYMPGTGTYGKLTSVASPANVIYIAESADSKTSDHFHPMLWGGATNLFWNSQEMKRPKLPCAVTRKASTPCTPTGTPNGPNGACCGNRAKQRLQKKLGGFYPGE
jgi:hypothetical protein